MPITIDLGGRRALVVGGAGVLGLACAGAFLNAGASVVLSDIDGDRLDAAVASLDAGDRASSVVADVTSGESCGELAAAAGAVDHFVCCAGTARIRPFAELTADEWNAIVAINMTGTFLVTQAIGRRMADRGAGSIVLLSSVAAHGARPQLAHYAAAKAGVLSITKSAAAAFAPQVRVNAVCPGYVPSPIWNHLQADVTALSGEQAAREYIEASQTRCLMGRPGAPEELAAAVLFLCSELASYVTGQHLNVDGGLVV
jgi:NAD(P)-dependent dehydrogenase (short-subunit alcohol dehydrogenase family)